LSKTKEAESMKANLLQAYNDMQSVIDNLMACIEGTKGLETMTISNMVYKATRLRGNIDRAYLSIKGDK
jgi:hypothetical protein